MDWEPGCEGTTHQVIVAPATNFIFFDVFDLPTAFLFVPDGSLSCFEETVGGLLEIDGDGAVSFDETEVLNISDGSLQKGTNIHGS